MVELTDVLATPEEVARMCDISLRVEDLTATKSLDANDSDKIFMLNSATEFTVTLPSIAEAGTGWRCKIVVKAAPSGADYVVTEKATHDTDKVIARIVNVAGAAGAESAGCTFITFADGQAVVGDWVEFLCDGTSWYVTGIASVAAGITAS